MADFPVITSPDGSTSFNIGSVMLADGVDYGMAGMFTNTLGGNPLIDGGGLGARYSGPRMFKFPIRLATVGNLTPAGVSRTLRQIAQGGAYVDLLLAGIATADAVRYDVIDGRVRETQDVKMWQGAGRREAMLELDVQPYGYLPTWITLASSASVGLPGTLVIPGGSIIGDVPGLGLISVMSNLPSQQLGAAATYGYDAFYYSLGNRAPAYVPVASMTSIVNSGGGLNSAAVADGAGPGATVFRVTMAPSAAALYPIQRGYQPVLGADLSTAYFGRYRLHAWARVVTASYGGAVPLAADVSISSPGMPTNLASGGLVASVGQPLTLAADGAYVPIPTGFGFYPLGDVTIPTSTGLAGAARRLRIWAGVPSTTVPTVALDIAGLWLQSLEGAQGIVSRDLQVANTSGSASYAGMYPFSIDAYKRDVQTAGGLGGIAAASLAGHWLASQMPAFSLVDRYRGSFPQLSPSMTSMEVMAGARYLSRGYAAEIVADTPKVWWRFNEPSGASVVVDYSGNGVNGAASNMLLGASSLLYGQPGGATVANGFVKGTGAAIPNANAPRTVEAWYKPATYAPVNFQSIVLLGASQAAGQSFGLGLFATSVLAYSVGNSASWAYAWKPGLIYHLAAAYSGTHVTMYVNGQAMATTTFAAAMTNNAQVVVGNDPFSTGDPAMGGIDEVAVYASALSADRILAHYVAGRNTMGATSPPVYQPGGYAGMSVRYRPQFTFTKEL